MLSAEKHFAVNQLAKTWGLSTDTIRRRFMNEPGVLLIRTSAEGKRVYTTMRIPASVAQRVYARLTVRSS
jgi:hypothetical protein